jgi:PKD domain
MRPNFFRTPRLASFSAAGRSKRRVTLRPQLERLDDRIVPAVRIWDGGGATNLWTDRFNWQGDLAPTAGDDLVFGPGADATSLTNSNDFGAGAAFNSITFTAGGYDLQGNTINLGPGGVTYDIPGAADAGSDVNLGPSGNFNRGGSFQDPGADSWVALVDYGDGNGPQPLKINPSGKFQLQHKYLAPGTYRVTVTILDDDGGIGTDSFLVTIPS